MTKAAPGYQPNPHRPLMLVAGAFGAAVLGLVGVLFLRAEPFVPDAVEQAGVVVVEYDLSTHETVGAPRTRFLVAVDVVPAAVLDVGGVDAGGREFVASWYEGSGDVWVSYRSKSPFAFDGMPIPLSGAPVRNPDDMTFVFGTWDRREKRLHRVYARTEVRMVAER